MASVVLKPSAVAIKGLKPKAQTFDARIDGHRGLWVRVYASGHKSFFYRSGQDGAMNRLTLKAQTLAEATAEWGELRRLKTQDGTDIAASRRQEKSAAQRRRVKERSEPTVQVLSARYIAEHARPKKRSWLQDEQRLNRYVLPKWGSIKAAEISRADVHSLVASLAPDTPVLANRVLALVRKLFSFAVDSGVLSIHPCLRMKAPAAEKARNRILADHEVQFLWRCTGRRVWHRLVPPEVAMILRLQLLTGCRHQEIRGARWKEFDFKKNEWVIPGIRSKNKLDHLVPLTASTIELLQSLAVSKKSVFVFPWPGVEGHVRADTLDRATREACKRVEKLGMDPFRPHDLRRTAETGLARLGIGREIRDRVLNHKDRSVSGIHYNLHDYLPEKRNALVRWDEEVHRLVKHV